MGHRSNNSPRLPSDLLHALGCPTGNGYAAKHIRFKARQLLMSCGMTSSDFEDLVHELWADVLIRVAKFDARRSSLNTFVATIVERKAASIVRHRYAAKRNPRRCETPGLHEPSKESPAEHGETVDVAQLRSNLIDMKLDLQLLIEMIESDSLRAVVGCLSRGGTAHLIAGELNISRRVVEREIEEIREIFEDAGMREYLN